MIISAANLSAFFITKKSPPLYRDGDFQFTDQSAVNGINATLRARLIAVVSSR